MKLDDWRCLDWTGDKIKFIIPEKTKTGKIYIETDILDLNGNSYRPLITDEFLEIIVGPVIEDYSIDTEENLLILNGYNFNQVNGESTKCRLFKNVSYDDFELELIEEESNDNKLVFTSSTLGIQRYLVIEKLFLEVNGIEAKNRIFKPQEEL